LAPALILAALADPKAACFVGAEVEAGKHLVWYNQAA
jgi:hypothetical protein